MNFKSLVLILAVFSIFSDEIFAVKKRLNEDIRNTKFTNQRIAPSSEGKKESRKNNLPQARKFTHKISFSFSTPKENLSSFKKTTPLRNYKGPMLSKHVVPPSIETKYSSTQLPLCPNRKKYQKINKNKALSRNDNLDKSIGSGTYKIEEIKLSEKFLQEEEIILPNHKAILEDQRILALSVEIAQIRQELDDIHRELNSSEFLQKIREHFNILNNDQKSKFKKATNLLDFKF